MQPKKIKILMLVTLTGFVPVAGMLTGCEGNGRVPNDTPTHAKQMKPDDDLMLRLPAFGEPDCVLDVKEDGYLLDGKRVRESSLRDELARAVSQGRKVLEIRVCDSISRKRDSISRKRLQYVYKVSGPAGFEHIILIEAPRKRIGGSGEKS